MAQNFVSKGKKINAAASYPATPKSGDPVVVGTIAGVAEVDEGAGGNAGGETTIATRGIFSLPVHGHDGTNPAVVAIGDRLYYAGGELNKDATGVLFGKALGGVGSDATTTIPVFLIQA